MGDDETFYDARDWEEDVRTLRNQLKREKRTVSETKKRERSWEYEALGLR